MQINIPQEQYELLTKRAVAEGFPDVTAFIVSFVSDTTEDPRGPLTQEELRESVAECEKSHAAIQAGGGRNFREAMLELGREFGFDIT